MNLLKPPLIAALILIIAAAATSSCGLEEYYELPQVSGGNITANLNTYAEINAPSIPQDPYYYATGYRIFYKIYLSSDNGGSSSSTGFNSTYVSDFNYFIQFTSPTLTQFPTTNTFSSRRYYEIDHEIGRGGGTIIIQFPTADFDYPTIKINNSENAIMRSRDVTRTLPPSMPDSSHEIYFRNTSGLNNNANATTIINADTASGQGLIEYAYAAMYIVAVGRNPQNFSQIYGKPTFISVFLLPNAY